MLPSSGYFKSCVCPFYNNGLCERPHCHYRHAKKDAPALQLLRRTSEESVVETDKMELLTMVNMALQRVQEDMARANLLTSAGSVESSPISYSPTPVEKDGTSSSINQNCESKKSSVISIPEYRPTPISQLRKLRPHTIVPSNFVTEQDDNSSEYDPLTNFATKVVKKRKRTEEYDPTEVKCSTKTLTEISSNKRKRTKNSDCIPCIVIESDDDDDCSISAKFSDSEDEPCVLENTVPPQIGPNEHNIVDKILQESKSTKKKLKSFEILQEKNVEVTEQKLITSKCTNKVSSNVIAKKIKIEKPDPINLYSTAQNDLEIAQKVKSIKKEKDEIVNTSYKSSDLCKVKSEYSKISVKIEKDTAYIASDANNDNAKSHKPKLIDISSTKTEKEQIQSKYNSTKPYPSILKITGINSKNNLKCSTQKKNVKFNLDIDIKAEPENNSFAVHNESFESLHNECLNRVDLESHVEYMCNSEKNFNVSPSKTMEQNDKGHEGKITDLNFDKIIHSSSFKKSDKADEEKVLKGDINKCIKNKSEQSKRNDSSLVTNTVKNSKNKPSGSIKSNEKSKSVKRSKCSDNIKDVKKIKSHKDVSHTNRKSIEAPETKEQLSSKENISKTLKEKVHHKNSQKHIDKLKNNKDVVKSKDKQKIIVDKRDPHKSSKYEETKHQKDKVKKHKSSLNKISDTNKLPRMEKSPEKINSGDKHNPTTPASEDSGNLVDILPEDLSDLDEHDTFEECWQIFNETYPTTESQQKDTKKTLKVQEKPKDLEVPGKKRVAHQSNFTRISPSVPPIKHITPGQAFHNRYSQIQERKDIVACSINASASSAFLSTVNNLEPGKKRIAHVPNAQLLAAVAQKQKAFNKAIETSTAEKTSTIAMTATKGVKRIAHTSSSVDLNNRPSIPVEYGSKVPTIIRQRYLNKLIDECMQLCTTQQEAYQRALDEEKSVYDRSSSKTIYLNVAINAVNRLRNSARTKFTAGEPHKNKADNSSSKTISHEYVLGGPKAAKTSYSIERNHIQAKVKVDLNGPKLYQIFKNYLMTPNQLKENGYPLPHPVESGKAIIEGIYYKKPDFNESLRRTCCRCQKKFQITCKGNYVVKEECVYHWGRLWKKRIAGALDSRYTCCQGDSQSEGCCVGNGHVHEGTESENLKGYVKTLPKSPPYHGNFGIYSLDCEMCYTTGGLELSRITVIDTDLKPVYESLVKSENTIVDHNTRFSGITEDDMIGVKTSLRDVQAVLLNMFNDKTILIGHSLESDFKALKLFHSTVIDTSVVFPHKMGLPYKRALRTLMAECLNKIIQNSVDGHDSQEDALACMELMMWKVKEDIRKQKR